MNSKFSHMRRKVQESEEKHRMKREKLASCFSDLSKLTFGGMFVGIIIPMFTHNTDMRMWMAALFGIVLTVLSAMLANKILG